MRDESTLDKIMTWLLVVVAIAITMGAWVYLIYEAVRLWVEYFPIVKEMIW